MVKLIFRQMMEHESSTYTYVLSDAYDPEKAAVLIDPVDLTAERDAKVLKELGLTLKYALNTHVHADHITGTYNLREFFPEMKSVLSRASGGKADILVNDGDTITFGGMRLEVLSTPGHTDGCVSYFLHGEGVAPMVFTGDTVLIRGCGRTDFQQGDAHKLYQGAWEKIFSLPKETAIYPAHDYKGLTSSTVAEELANNERLTKNEAEFVEIMNNLNLPYPAKIEESLPRNMVDGMPVSESVEPRK